ncbi:hypothetical protein [Halorubellus sp. PRR65]|uniref:hypothetical protein n=1 Tax=Halorubellus sp. PRR65 TaxID=3098148 RepID=UPI002B264690|nr:hypothetical protein [Halorubellus sp. PRR65]
MPGAGRSNSRTMRVVGALVAIVAVLGGAFGDWSFDGLADGPLPVVIGVVAAALALGATWYARTD